MKKGAHTKPFPKGDSKPLKWMENQGSDPSALCYITVKQHRSSEYNDLTFIVTFPGAVPYPNCGKRKAGYWTGGESKK